MKRIAPTVALIVAAAIALTVTVAVSPSYATVSPRSLPAGQTMFALSCDSRAPDLWTVDAATAVGTQVGTGTPTANFCSGQPAWDAVTKTAYFPDWMSFPYHLSTMNLLTGVTTVGAQFTVDGAPAYVDAISISPTGAAFAVIQSTLYSLNLDTAALTLPRALTENGLGVSNLFGFAFSPAGVLYALTSTGELYSIDTSTGASTLVTTLNLPDPQTPGQTNSRLYSMQFDSAGILWVENDYRSSVGSADLWSVDLTAADISASAVRSGTFTVGGAGYYTEALLIVPFTVPVFTSAAEAAGTVGSAFTFTATTSGGEGTTYAITAGALPAGLVLDAATGIISGTPTGAGTFAFTITATNPMGTTDQPFTLAIAAAAPEVHLPVVSG